MKHAGSRRPSLATILASIALVIALGGTAVAASRYVITSTSQIKPSVVDRLRGHRGPHGKQGKRGATGSTGAPGATGPAGAVGPPGPAGGAAGDSANATPASQVALNSNGTPLTIASTSIGSGRYFVTATSSLENTAPAVGSTSPRATATCSIVNSVTGPVADTSVAVPPQFGGVDGTIDAMLQAWQTSSAPSSTDSLQCSTTFTNIETQAAGGVTTANITALGLSESSSLG